MDGSSNLNPKVGNTLGVHVHCADDITVRRGTVVVPRAYSRKEVEGEDVAKHLRAPVRQILVQAVRPARFMMNLDTTENAQEGLEGEESPFIMRLRSR